MEEMLNHLPGVTSVHSRFYDLSSKYYQTVGDHASYYKDALRFLGCVGIKDLPGDPGLLQPMCVRSCLSTAAVQWLGQRVSDVTWSLTFLKKPCGQRVGTALGVLVSPCICLLHLVQKKIRLTPQAPSHPFSKCSPYLSQRSW